MKRLLLLVPLLTIAALALGACTVMPTAVPTAVPTPTPSVQATAQVTATLPATTGTPAESTDEPTGEPAATDTPAEPAVLSIMTHDSFSVSEEVVAQFQAQCGCTVQFLKSGDTGLALNRALLSKNNPLADVFFGVDNSFMTRALAGEIFEPYDSPALEQIPDDLKLDPENRLLPVDFGYVTLNYDREYFSDNNIPLPTTLQELADPAYNGMLVVQNPATSSPGLSFLLATVDAFGETGDYT